jgi:hypothetical protein
MKRIRIVGLCLLAVFALTAVAASSASAGTYYKCAAQKKGEYTESGCKTKSAKAKKGKFELVQVQGCSAAKKGEYTNSTCTTKSAKAKKGKFEKTGVPFTAKGGTARLGTPAFGPADVECTASSTVGELTGPKTDTERVTFTGCTFEGKTCQSPGPFGSGSGSGTAGTITTNQLKSKLVDNGEKSGGYLAKEPAPGEAWDEITSGEHEPYSSEFICGTEVILRTHGSLSGVVTPVNTLSTASTATFAVGSGEQGLLTEVFNGTEFIPAGGAPSTEETTAAVTDSIPIEVKT